MKAAPFDYVRPASLDEACALLAADSDARLISGGQTLVPMMAMRLARPSKLIDIARLPELKGIKDGGDAIIVGAATKQVEIERSPLIAQRLPLLAAAILWVGHAPTRARGTVGGSIANADPAAEIPLVLTTLGGTITIRTGNDRQTLTTDEFFLGPMTTAVPTAGCVVEVRFPTWAEKRVGIGFHEVSARKSDFAYVSAAAQVALDASGNFERLAIGIGGATSVPTRLDSMATELKGKAPTREAIAQAAVQAAAGLDIMRDGHASEAYRRRVSAGLAERAIMDAVAAASAKGDRA